MSDGPLDISDKEIIPTSASVILAKTAAIPCDNNISPPFNYDSYMFKEKGCDEEEGIPVHKDLAQD